MVKFKQTDASRILSPAEKQLYSADANLFAFAIGRNSLSESHTERIRWGLCCGHLGVRILLGGVWRKKKVAPLSRLLWSFSSFEKGRICFCAR